MFFLEKLLNAQLKFHTHFGKYFEKYIEEIAIDLEEIGEIWKKLSKKMSAKEQEKILINNILNLYVFNKKPTSFTELITEKVKYY